MKKVWFVMMILLFILPACSIINGTDLDYSQTAKDYVHDFFDQNANKLLENYELTDALADYLTEEVYKEIYDKLNLLYGDYIELHEIIESEKDGYIVVECVCELEAKYLNMIVVFEKNGTITGFRYTENNGYTPEDEKSDYVFFGGEYQIKGKLTLPDGEGPFPVMIMVHGSGASNMNGGIYSLTPYKDIAEYLKNKGIAVFRYDKRTYLYSEVSNKPFSELTVYDEVIDDVVYAYDYLLTQPEIQSENIFIAGHSFGGYLLPRIAEKTPLVKGYIFLAASAVGFEDVTMNQTNYLCYLDNIMSDEEKVQVALIEEQCRQVKAIEDYTDRKEMVNALGSGFAYWYDLKDYNPVQLATTIEQPMLFLHGERDYQVSISNWDEWKNGLSTKENAVFISYEKINHNLMTGEGKPSPEEYKIENSVSTVLMDDMIDFIHDHLELKEEE